MLPLQIHLTLPPWIGEVADERTVCASDDQRVALAVELSRQNVVRGGGGPFGAAVFEADSGRLIAVGVNRVVPQGCSVAHAEMMALMIAQQRLGRHRLNAGDGHYVLASSAQPCCQCYGATIWAGIDRLLIGARAEDVEALTEFDEGPLPADWLGELERRGIAVRRDILRDSARSVLAAYGAGGTSY
jgi:Cytosine/adenosine deaminases